MFDTNEKIGKILGNGQGQGIGLPRQGLGFGRGMGPGAGFNRGNTNFNINPRETIGEIQRLLDKLPEVKKADGKITIEFIDGTKGNFIISYK